MSETRFRIEVIQASELAKPNRSQQLPHINELINDAYWISGHPDESGQYAENHFGPKYTSKRIQSENQIVGELGEVGLFAICTDESIAIASDEHSPASKGPTRYSPGKYGNIVAVASMKPWAGKRVLLFQKVRAQAELSDNNDGSGGNLQIQDLVKQSLADQRHAARAWEWEISTCATADGAQYRGKGLMTKCVDALIEHLRFLQKQLRESGDPRGGLPIHLWVTALVGSPNPSYWARRGFVNDGPPDAAPKGMWTSLSAFEIQTMKKELS